MSFPDPVLLECDAREALLASQILEESGVVAIQPFARVLRIEAEQAGRQGCLLESDDERLDTYIAAHEREHTCRYDADPGD